MPDILIIAPDGLVKVEPSRCIFCGRLAVCEDPARCKYCDRAYDAGAKAERERHAERVREVIDSFDTTIRP